MKLPRCRVDGTLNMIVGLKLVGCWCRLSAVGSTYMRTSIAVQIRRGVISMHTKVKPFHLPLWLKWIVAEFQSTSEFGTMTMAAATQWFWIKAKHICEGRRSPIKYSHVRLLASRWTVGRAVVSVVASTTQQPHTVHSTKYCEKQIVIRRRQFVHWTVNTNTH